MLATHTIAPKSMVIDCHTNGKKEIRSRYWYYADTPIAVQREDFNAMAGVSGKLWRCGAGTEVAERCIVALHLAHTKLDQLAEFGEGLRQDEGAKTFAV